VHDFIITIFVAGKIACQDQDEGDNIEAEQDELLIDCAGSVLSKLGQVISPDAFALCFQKVLPLLLKRLVLHSIICRSKNS
jgi:hypothetical protein